MPQSWYEIKKQKICLSDITKLKTAFNIERKVDTQIEMATAKGSEILDPVVQECEGAYKGVGYHKVHKDYAKIEFPIKSMGNTKTSPSVKWCMNIE